MFLLCNATLWEESKLSLRFIIINQLAIGLVFKRMEFALWSLVIDLLPIFDGFEFIKRSSSSYSKLFIKDCPKCREKNIFYAIWFCPMDQQTKILCDLKVL